MALESAGSVAILARATPPGGGAVGTNGHDVSTVTAATAAFFGARLAAFLAALASSAALAGAEVGSFFRPLSAVAARLLGPRMGKRGVKIHPTPGTGLPPMRRPSSKSQGCSPWNSWNESFDNTTAPVRSAMRNTKASPRPMAPAGGETTSPFNMASRKASRSDSAMRCSNEASTTTVIWPAGSSSAKVRTASSSWARLGKVRPSVAKLEPSTTTWWESANGPPHQVCLLQIVQGRAADGRTGRLAPAHVA